MYRHIDAEHAPLDHLAALVQGGAVAQGLLGRGVGLVLGDVPLSDPQIDKRVYVSHVCLPQLKGAAAARALASG